MRLPDIGIVEIDRVIDRSIVLRNRIQVVERFENVVEDEIDNWRRISITDRDIERSAE